MLLSVSTPADSSSQEICADCVKHQGLCKKHKKSVLPQLAQPHWYRLVGNQQFIEKKQKPDPRALRIIRRKERLRAKRLRELVDLIATPKDV